jgi:hypothetical protein
VDYQTKAKQYVVDYFNKKVEKTDGVQITTDNVYVVWFVFAAENWKCLLSTTVSDGMYYEVTHKECAGETYFDAYKKFDYDVFFDVNNEQVNTILPTIE